MTTEATGLVVRKSLTVNVPAERAFRVFTDELETWWPLEKFAIAADGKGGRPQHAVFEPREGGLVYELADGQQHEWADVLVFDPPTRLVLRWRVNPENPPTEVEVTFTPEAGATRVDLEHRGWEAFGDGAAESYGGYNSGWDVVLDGYRQATDQA